MKYLSKSHYVLAPYNNKRIQAQKGDFIIAPFTESIDSKNKLDYIDFRADKDVFSSSCFIIPAKVKKDLLKELDFIGINESTIYPDMEHLMSYLNKAPFHYDKGQEKLGINVI